LLLITGCQHKPVSPAVDILPIATPVVEKPYDGNYPDLIFDAGEENENRGWQKEPCIDNSNTICGHKAVTRDADIPDIHNMYNRGIVR
jgi:hypothetical protein